MNRRKPTTQPTPAVRIPQMTKEHFSMRLRDFHCTRKTPFYHAPIVFGKRQDLQKLYTIVVNFGGFRKVNEQHLWPKVLDGVGLHKYCINAELAIRHVYQRYLEPYERSQGIKDDKDPSYRMEDHSDDSELGRFKRSTLGETVATSYNVQNHIIPAHMRATWSLSEDLSDGHELPLLEKALLSGLPNEVDFAINTCLLLSNQPGALMLSRNPKIADLLVAHAGVFDEGARSYYPLLEDWKRDKRNLLRFWHESVWDHEFRCLLHPIAMSCDTVSSDDFDSCPLTWRLFAMTPDLSLRDAEGQRVLLVATILRNLVLDDRYNAAVLSRSPPAVRFLLLCAACRHANLRGLALDALVALPLILRSMNLHRHLLTRLLACLSSTDRMELVRGLELLSQLAGYPENCDVLSEALTDDLVIQLTSSMLLRDLQLLLAALEAIYKLSGISQCIYKLAKNKDLIQCLLALLSFEASQIGGQGIIGIKIFQGTQAGVAVPSAEHPVQQQMPQQQQQQQQPNIPQRVALLPRVSMPPPTAVPLPSQPQQVLTTTSDLAKRSKSPPTPNSSAPAEKHAFAEWWLRAFYEPHPQASVSRVLIYSEYVRAYQRQFGTSQSSLGAQDFHNLVKEVFPGMEQIKVQMSEGKVEIHYNKVKHVQDAEPVPPSLPLPASTPRVNHETKLPIPARPPTPPLTPPSPNSRKRRHSSSSVASSNSDVLTAEDPKPHKENQQTSNSTQVGHEAVIERVLNRCVNRMDQQKPIANGVMVNGCLSPAASESSQDNAVTINGHASSEQQSSSSVSSAPSIIIQFCPPTTAVTATPPVATTTSPNNCKPIMTNGVSPPRPNPPLGLVCEWDECWRCYETPAKVFHHVYHTHLPTTPSPCRWKGCDHTGVGVRAPLSLLAHLQERHCSTSALQASLDRRREAAVTGKSPNEPPSAAMVPLPCNAARQAILRLAAPEKVAVAREGPVTKHLRLTAALALRNLTSAACETLRAHINVLAEAALIGGEAAPTISQCISQL